MRGQDSGDTTAKDGPGGSRAKGRNVGAPGGRIFVCALPVALLFVPGGSHSNFKKSLPASRHCVLPWVIPAQDTQSRSSLPARHVTRTYTVLSTENVYHSAAADTQMLSLKSITTLQWVTAAPLMVSHGAYFKSETNRWQ